MDLKKKGSYKYFSFLYFNNSDAIVMWQNVSAKSWLLIPKDQYYSLKMYITDTLSLTWVNFVTWSLVYPIIDRSGPVTYVLLAEDRMIMG